MKAPAPRSRGALRRSLAGLLVIASFGPLAGCGSTPGSGPEEDLGPIEALVDEVGETVWPGNVLSNGGRHVRLLNGFFNGEPSAYWFAGFAPRITADIFWFCPEGDERCPLDDRGRIDRTHTLGLPVFARIPGDATFSPFWLIWVVRVGPDYRPDDIKSVAGIERAAAEGNARVELAVFDHGGGVGQDSAIMHCMLVLAGTELEGNGDEIVNRPGVKSVYVPLRQGWFKQHRLHFYDFTINEGVFPPNSASESRPLMPSADIFVLFRDCDNGSKVPLCDLANKEFLGAVSERGVESDLTLDGDKADNNNVISGFPRTEPPDPRDKRYSPLWRVNVVRIVPEHDGDFGLIDSTGQQNGTDVKSPADIRAYVEKGYLYAPEPMSEEQAGNRIPGNDGKVFFNCPSQIPAE